MTVVKSLSLVPVVVLAMVLPALGQDAATSPEPRSYFIGLGGVAFNTDFERPATALAVEYGERVHQDVLAYATLNYVANLMSERMRSNLVVAGRDLTQVSGVPWEFRGGDRGLAFSVGGKFLMPIASAYRPYFGAGFGALNLKRRIIERDLGDVSEDFFLLTGLNDGVIDAGQTAVTRPLAELLVGVSGATGRTYVDIAYRYRKAFNSFEPIAFSQVTVGLGVGF
jgi:hypothetical protein